MAFDVQRRSVSRENVLHDSKSETRAALVAGTAPSRTIESLRDAHDLIRLEPDAVVPHGQPNIAACLTHRAHVHPSSRICVFDRIVDEVGQHLTYPVAITSHVQAVVYRDPYVDVFLPRCNLKAIANLFDNRSKIERSHRELQCAGLQSGDLRKIRREGVKTVCVMEDLLHEAPADTRIIEGPIQQRLGKSPNRKNRGLDFVRHVSHVVTTEVLGAILLGDPLSNSVQRLIRTPDQPIDLVALMPGEPFAAPSLPEQIMQNRRDMLEAVAEEVRSGGVRPSSCRDCRQCAADPRCGR